MTISIDVDAARRMAQEWSDLADRVTYLQFEVEAHLRRLSFEHGDAGDALAAASTAVAALATLTSRLVDAAFTSDAFVAPVALHSPYTPRWGDLAALEGRDLAPWVTTSGTTVAIGRARLAQALDDAINAARIRPDEFELVDLGAGTWLVVLPGVTDLSKIDIGSSEDNRTTRDVDQSALGSWRNSRIDGNPYATVVWQSLLREGVPAGAELILVGHSFGADTALDLAREPAFNGPQGYRVSHVLAAGYAIADEFTGIPDDTDALAINSDGDKVVRIERIANAVVDAMAQAGSGGSAFGPGPFVPSPFLSRGGSTSANHREVEFDGGDVGHGHHPINYAEFIRTTDAPEVVAMAAAVGAAGAFVSARPKRPRHVPTAPARALDVTRPEP